MKNQRKRKKNWIKKRVKKKIGTGKRKEKKKIFSEGKR